MAGVGVGVDAVPAGRPATQPKAVAPAAEYSAKMSVATVVPSGEMTDIEPLR